MNPLPESAVELAALVKVAEEAFWPAYLEAKRTHGKDCHATGMRAALTAALPAIREAVVGDFLRLADRWDVRADLEDMEGGPFFDESERDQLLACATEIRALAALTEQENRNGL